MYSDCIRHEYVRREDLPTEISRRVPTTNATGAGFCRESSKHVSASPIQLRTYDNYDRCKHNLGRFMVTTMDLGSLHPAEGSVHSAKKVELGRRLGLAAAAAVYADREAVWRGPRLLAANATAAAGSGRPTGAVLHVAFESDPGSGGVTLDMTAVCPATVLPVFCTGAGFEGLSALPSPGSSGGAWVKPQSVSLLPVANTGGNTAIVELKFAPAVISRLRYAYADWPVCSIRNANSTDGAGYIDPHTSLFVWSSLFFGSLRIHQTICLTIVDV